MLHGIKARVLNNDQYKDILNKTREPGWCQTTRYKHMEPKAMVWQILVVNLVDWLSHLFSVYISGMTYHGLPWSPNLVYIGLPWQTLAMVIRVEQIWLVNSVISFPPPSPPLLPPLLLLLLPLSVRACPR